MNSSSSLRLSDSVRKRTSLAVDERDARVLVAVAIAIALLAWMGWRLFGPLHKPQLALLCTLGVVVVAYRFAMMVARPMALMAAKRRGAQLGVSVNGTSTWERGTQLTTIVLDKTGTLTRGQPVVQEIVTTGDFSQAEVLSLAAAAESFSEHPLGAAIVRYAQRQSTLMPRAHDFQSFGGLGIQATIEAEGTPLQVLVGNTRLMRERHIDLAPFENAAAQLKIHGHTTVFVAVDGLAAGLIAIVDALKADAARTVERLHRMGLEVVMLTGDNRTTAQHIAHEAGIGWIMAEVLPRDKVREIEKLQREGKIVAMVGDGINDAALLAQADLGIAMGSGTDVDIEAALEAADITLAGGDLRGVTRAIELSRATTKAIRQNVCWAFALNVLGIPLAAGLLYPLAGWLLSPILAALALSSVSVVTNALCLNRLKFRD